jgi:hypothetical protein
VVIMAVASVPGAYFAARVARERGAGMVRQILIADRVRDGDCAVY